MRSATRKLLLLASARRPASLPSGAAGVWYADTSVSSPRLAIPNAASIVPVSANLFATSRRFFNIAGVWQKSGITIVDAAATAPDGSSDASTFNATGNWQMHPPRGDTIPAGTYTLAINAKRNTGTDQQFCFSKDGVVSRSPVSTATSVWQRFTYTFTLGAGSDMTKMCLCSIDGTTAANLQAVDFEMYAGSSDLGPQVFAGHLYLGASAFDTRPTYSGGELHLESSGFGVIQYAAATSVSTVTLTAVVAKTATGAAFQTILSRAQNYGDFGLFSGQSGLALGYLTSAGSTKLQQSGIYEPSAQGYHAITLRVDGTNVDFFVDDVLLLHAVATPSGAVSLSDFLVNDASFAGLFGKQKFNSIALWYRALSNTEVATAVRFQTSRAVAAGLTVTPAARVVTFEGDSITGAFSFSWPYLFGPNASPVMWGANYAIAGNTITDLVARASTIDAILPVNKAGRKFILTVFVGANDLRNWPGATDAAAMADWLTQVAAYCDARRAAGWKVVIITVLPQSGSLPTGLHNTRRAIVNPTLASWSGVHADAVANFAAEATMGLDATAANTTYYSDGTHPTAAGMALLEAVARPVINGL